MINQNENSRLINMYREKGVDDENILGYVIDTVQALTTKGVTPLELEYAHNLHSTLREIHLDELANQNVDETSIHELLVYLLTADVPTELITATINSLVENEK